jgi:broad specificity phosphatase PhoE
VTLLLLRHGESTGNILRLIQGWHDFPLTDRGHRQAAAAAGRLATASATALYTSPLARARSTAAAVEHATGLDAVTLPDLREYCFGEAQNMRWEDAAARWGFSDTDWGVGKVPGEEGMEAFRGRVSRTFETLAARHADDLAIVVLHAGTIGAIVEYVCGLAPHEHVALYTGNCGIGTIEQIDGRSVIVGLNDQSHLPERER